jgi:hypothetical protein
MDMKRFAFAAAITMVLASVSQAAILNTAIRAGLNSINDRNVDRLSTDLNGNGLIDVGDVLESVLIFDNISNAQFGATPLETAVGIPTYQLTAHIFNTVSAKVPLGGGVFAFTMIPSTINVYEDHAGLSNTILLDFSSQSANAAVTAATDGSLILTLDTSGTGFAGSPDTWRATGSDNFTLLTTGNEANYVAALSILANPGLIPIGPDATLSGVLGVPAGTGDLHDVVAVGEVEVAAAPIVAQGWAAQSDTTVSFIAVPEPISLVVWSALSGLVGLAVYRRRKN